MRAMVALATLWLSAPGAASAADRVRLELEGGPVWQTRNVFAVPGDGGTRVSLSDYEAGPFAAGRATLFWDLGEHSSLRLLAAPLRLDVDFVPASPILFQGQVFAPGAPTRGRYQFDSYRLSWVYRFGSSGPWSFRAGLTAKLRHARIALEGGGLAAEKKNTGFVPLLYGGARYQAGRRLALDLEADALGAPQGYAIDAALRAELRLGSRLDGYLGYRLLRGGADNDEVYTFATFHYATAGLVLRF